MTLARGGVVGETAPQVTLTRADGSPLRLPSGVPTLIVFLPLAFTPVCSGELAELDAARAQLDGVLTVGVSCDSPAVLRAWAQSVAVDVELASDFWPHGAAARAFDALDEAHGWPRRVSVLLSAGGRVLWRTESAPGLARDMAEHVAAARSLDGAA